MTERIFIGVAWPYANSPLHLGQIAGAYLPPDIFARYHRAKGNEVLMVSGSDQHGTPITIRAEQEGKSPDEIVARYHASFLESWQKLGITFDLFTSTGTINHTATAQDMFLTLLKKDYIYKDTVSQAYCTTCLRFLPDRYIEGTCPYCGYESARGDQCDQCGKPLNTADVVKPYCRFCSTPPEFRDSEHFFLKLSAFETQLLDWVKQQTHWRPNVLNFTRRYLEEGLRDRAITRDIGWGIPVPLKGYEGKRLYVWFEAVIGYLSASKEWAQNSGCPEGWRPFWQGETKSYYFIGKDNIPFHTIVWPAMLLGYGGLNLPYDVPSNEYLTMEGGGKLSSSRNKAIWLPDYLEHFDPDPLRYALAVNMPETSDASFSWPEFTRRNNDELVATYGNLAQRVLTFTYRQFEGKVPQPGELDESSTRLIAAAEDTIINMDNLLYRCRFREAMKAAMTLAQEANRYLEEKSPWKVINEDRQAAATALYTAITVISALCTVMYPFLPFSSSRLSLYLGFNEDVEKEGWTLRYPHPGQQLADPKPLFAKLKEKMVLEDMAAE